MSADTAMTVSSASLAAAWTTSATSGVGTASDTGVGAATGWSRVGGGANTGGGEGRGGDGGGGGVILRRFGAFSPSPPSVSSSLPRLSSRGLSVVVGTTKGRVGATARSSMAGVGAATAGEGGNRGDVDEDSK